MTHEKPFEPAAHRTTVDTESPELRRRKRLAVGALQAPQRADHVLSSGELGGTAVGTELPMPGKSHDNHTRQHPEQQLAHQHRDEVSGATFALPFAQHSIHSAPDDTREHDY